MLRRLRSAPTPLLGIADAALAGVLAVTGTVRRSAVPRAIDRTIALTVVDRRIVAHDHNVVALTLAARDRGELPAWHPGAHLDIHLPSGRVRQYSLCGEPALRDTYRIAVRRIPGGGGGSVEVHDTLNVGTAVTTSGPRNAFPLSIPGYGSPAQRLRFIAGGIGITPILPMLDLANRLGVALRHLSGDRATYLTGIARGTVTGVIYGIIGTGIAQGVLAAIGFAMAGVPGAVLLGVATFFLSVLPVVPPLIWIGATIWLLQQGDMGWAIFMAMWGFFGISMVDNVIKPFIISRGASLPFAIVFLGVLGGVLAFGVIGVFLGPALLAVGYRLAIEWTATDGDKLSHR